MQAAISGSYFSIGGLCAIDHQPATPEKLRDIRRKEHSKNMLAPLNDLDGCPDGVPTSLFIRTQTGRKSIKLGVGTLRALHEIVEREQVSLAEICSLVDAKRSPKETLTEAFRSYVLNYFRAASTEEGHKSAGHGARRAAAKSG